MKILIKLFLIIVLVITHLSSEVLVRDNVSLREGKGAFYPVVTVLSQGTDVKIITDENFWKKIRTTDNMEGWIPSGAFSESGQSINFGLLLTLGRFIA